MNAGGPTFFEPHSSSGLGAGCLIPTEVVDAILDKLNDSPQSLRQCALVHPSWVPRARNNDPKFRILSFGSMPALHALYGSNLVAGVHSRPFYSTSCIRFRELHLQRGLSESDIRCFLHIFGVNSSFKENFRGLRQLVIHSPPGGARLLVDLARRFEGLQSLGVHSASFSDAAELRKTISAFSELEELTLTGIKLGVSQSESDSGSKPESGFPRNLRLLVLRVNDGGCITAFSQCRTIRAFTFEYSERELDDLRSSRGGSCSETNIASIAHFLKSAGPSVEKVSISLCPDDTEVFNKEFTSHINLCYNPNLLSFSLLSDAIDGEHMIPALKHLSETYNQGFATRRSHSLKSDSALDLKTCDTFPTPSLRVLELGGGLTSNDVPIFATCVARQIDDILTMEGYFAALKELRLRMGTDRTIARRDRWKALEEKSSVRLFEKCRRRGVRIRYISDPV